MTLGERSAGAARVDPTGRATHVDIAVCLVLFAGTVAYLSRWAHDFYGFDEGIYLYEAKRVSEGAVMYRDFFEILTPGFFHYMGAVFGVLGASFEAGRLGMAIIHGLIGALLYAICRRARMIAA